MIFDSGSKFLVDLGPPLAAQKHQAPYQHSQPFSVNNLVSMAAAS